MYFMKLNLLLIFVLSSQALLADVNKGLDFVKLSVGIEKDHQLPKNYRKEALRFDGSFKRYSRISYIKKESKIRFTPFKAGFGVLLIKNKKNQILKRITIDVQETMIHRIVKEADSLLKTIDGIEIKNLNNKVFIDGQIYLPQDMDRIQAVVKQYEPFVVSLVTFSPDAQNNIARLIQSEINQPTVEVKAIHNKFILQGTVSTEEEKAKIELIAHLYTEYDSGRGFGVQSGAIKKRKIKRVINNIQVSPPKKKIEKTKLVRVTTHYVGLKKDYNKGFSFQWSPVLRDDGTQLTYQQSPVGSLASTVTATINNLFPKLNWAKSFGFARVLHNATIMIEDAQRGEINITTQIPVTTVVNNQVQTSTSNVAVSTAVTPTVTGPLKNTVRMKLALSVGNVAGRSNSGPTTTERKIDTTLHVSSGQSGVVGGLISSSLSRDFNRLPQGNAGTPLINLVAGKSYDTNHSQFVIFITPLIQSTASAHARKIKEAFRVDEE